MKTMKIYVPIKDSSVKRKLTDEERTLNIESCDNFNEICDTTAYTHSGAINIIENRDSLVEINDSNGKLWKIIDNLGENELFEDPDFPAGPNALFYR